MKAGDVAVTVASLLALTTACATAKGTRGPTPAARDVVKVIGVAPDPTIQLHPGEVVAFRVKLQSTLASADLGHVGLVIQDDRGRNLKKGGTQSRMAVARGVESVELPDQATVPLDARWLEVFVPLFPEGATRTSAVDSVRFLVVR